MNDPLDEHEHRRRQKSRALITALILGALVVLFYAITIVKIGAGYG